jgi:hypothetical protein
MDMLDRYLQAVKFFLPRREAEDIIRELSENLIAKMQDREEELGRPLEEAEEAAILRDHGHPLLVAGRYRTRQQLIGPAFFPLYISTLKMGIGVALLVSIVVAVVTALLSADPFPRLLEMMLGFPGRALMVFAWTTLGFAALDYASTRVRLTHDWDPRKLPKVMSEEQQIPRLKTFWALAFTLIYVVWLLLAPRSPWLALGPLAALVHYAPVWRVVYLPMVLLAVATAVLHVIDFVRPYRASHRELIRVAIGAGSLFVFAFLARAGDLFLPSAAAASAEGVDVTRVADVVNASFHIGFAVAGAITAFEIWRGLLRMKRWRGTTVSSDQRRHLSRQLRRDGYIDPQ